MTGVNSDRNDIQLSMGERISAFNLSSKSDEDDLTAVINGLLGNECEFKPFDGKLDFVFSLWLNEEG